MQSIPTEENLITDRNDELSLIPKPLYDAQTSPAQTYQQAKEAALEEVGGLQSPFKQQADDIEELTVRNL